MRNYEISADKLHRIIEIEWNLNMKEDEEIRGLSTKQTSSVGDLYFVEIV